MNKKTKRRYKRHYKRSGKKSEKRRRVRRRVRRRSYRKRRNILTLPGSKGLPLFITPEKTHVQSIPVNQHQSSGNMIPGLRHM
jgi:hypothetical protein